MRVRFPSPAPTRKRRSTGLTRSPSSPRRWTHAPAASTTRPKTPGHPGHPPAARRSPPSSPATPRATGRHQNSPECSTSTPPPPGHPAPRMVSARLLHPHRPGTYRLNTPTRHHPRQPHPTPNYAALAGDRLRRPLTRHPLTWKSARERRRLGAGPISTIFAAQVATWLSAAQPCLTESVTVWQLCQMGTQLLGEVRVELDGPVEVGQRLVVTLHQSIVCPAASDSPGVARVKLDGPVEVGQRLVVTLHFLEGLPAGSDGPGVAGVKLDGPGEVGERLVVTLHQAVGLPAAGDSPGVAGVKLDGPGEVGQRLVVTLHFLEGLPAAGNGPPNCHTP